MDAELLGRLVDVVTSAYEEMRELNQGIAGINSALGDLVECEKQHLEAYGGFTEEPGQEPF